MKVPKQDSDVSAKVDCFWQGRVQPPHYLPFIIPFSPIFSKKNGRPFGSVFQGEPFIS